MEVSRKLKTAIGKSFPAAVPLVRQFKTQFETLVKLLNFLPLAVSMSQLTFNYGYDFQRFCKWSSLKKKKYSRTQLRALITMDYHRIEKGLALKEPRVGFGENVVKRLLSNLQSYQQTFGLDTTGQIALNSLFAYYNFNRENGVNDDLLYQNISVLRKTIIDSNEITNCGGILKVTKQSILDAAKIELKNFFESRYSIRHFTSEEVDISLIKQAVKMAQKTPSVCNRQSSKVYVFTEDEDKKKVLSYQNGNRGFGDQVSKVLIVTCDLEHFVSIGERNQCWIDGGMFAMSLIYALHSLGLGTCCLNWSVELEIDRELRMVAGVGDSEAIIMMIAVGHIPEQLNIAQSPRKRLEEILIVN
ncbi:MAG: nitroreductase family protein [Xenococcaceae cyanobacterium MO_188.B32]|nr:nitroreductase family protein [Xenococcaceae cyanobacterium MO_188.B32]